MKHHQANTNTSKLFRLAKKEQANDIMVTMPPEVWARFRKEFQQAIEPSGSTDAEAAKALTVAILSREMPNKVTGPNGQEKNGSNREVFDILPAGNTCPLDSISK